MKRNKIMWLYIILAGVIMIQIFGVPAVVREALDMQKNQIIQIAE